MATFRVRLKDFDKAAANIEAMARAAGEEVPSGMRIIAEEIMTDVKASRPGKGVPLDFGPLNRSGVVNGPTAGVVDITFGGASAPYALRQHEELQYRHTVGEARYLVRGAERWAAGGRPQHALREMADAIIDRAKA